MRLLSSTLRFKVSITTRLHYKTLNALALEITRNMVSPTYSKSTTDTAISRLCGLRSAITDDSLGNIEILSRNKNKIELDMAQ